MKTSLLEYVQEEITDCDNNIKKYSEKFERNWINAFEWNAEDMIIHHYKKQLLTGFVQYMEGLQELNHSKIEQWLSFNIETIKEQILRRRLLPRSTSITTNFSEMIQKETKCHLLEIYERWLKWVTSTDPIPLTNKQTA